MLYSYSHEIKRQLLITLRVLSIGKCFVTSIRRKEWETVSDHGAFVRCKFQVSIRNEYPLPTKENTCEEFYWNTPHTSKCAFPLVRGHEKSKILIIVGEKKIHNVRCKKFQILIFLFTVFFNSSKWND